MRHYNLFGERRVHFNTHRKLYFVGVVNGYMKITFAIV